MNKSTWDGNVMEEESEQQKSERLQIRIDAYSKRMLERAADYTHKTISEFILTTSLAAAEKVIVSHTNKVFTDTDWNIFYDALMNPPSPNSKLRRAMQKYQQENDE